MINKLLSTLICIVVLSSSSCGESPDPVAYNNSIITIINDSEKHVTEMNDAMNRADYAKAETVRDLWESSIDQDIKKVEALGSFQGDSIFQQAVLNGLMGYHKILTDDYPKLISIRKEASVKNARLETQLLNNINSASKNMANAVNQASEQFEKRYRR